MNIVELIFARADPLALAVVSAEEKMTYGELFDQVDRAAQEIAKSSARRVGLDCPNGIAHIVLALAIVKTGKCLVPLPGEIARREREELIRQTGVEAVVKGDGSIQLVANRASAEFSESRLTALDPAFIRFSSGTTGQSKGIVLSHESLLARISAANRGLQITSKDRIIWILPMAHHFAVSIILYLWRGATTIVVKSHLAGDVLAAARLHGGTVIYGSPFHYALLAAETSDQTWPALRLAVSTAAPLPQGTAEGFFKKFGIPLTQGLGVIEVGLPLLNLEFAREKPTSIGKPLPGYEAKISEGQLLLRGPGMLDAYLSPWRLREEILEDGWFRTGDLARVDADGCFHLEGRVSSVINIAGMKCFPEEVEAILGSHDGIRAVRVSGRPHPKMGEVPIAEIIPRDFAHPPTVASLTALCRNALARHKIPVDFQMVESLPVTASGKIKRHGSQ